LLSVRGFPVGVAVCGALEDVRGRRDLGPGGLQGRLFAMDSRRASLVSRGR